MGIRPVLLSLMRVADLGTQLAYRVSGGRLGERQLRYSVLLLHSLGRKTNKMRTHALLYVRNGDDFVVCASNFGAPNNPAWYWNLQAHSRARIQAGRRRIEVVARTADPDERRHLWEMLLSVRPQYADYQAATSRKIPVVILTPIDTDSHPDFGKRTDGE
ncbi:MAG TPA: nitroreductase family deazaflavin-dependent oxidoreductase [Chloroflexota bacterium]|nr:nitroreductase family deazaflavin-dependent oxidoreductase [Chloroflexota bacterium]